MGTTLRRHASSLDQRTTLDVFSDPSPNSPVFLIAPPPALSKVVVVAELVWLPSPGLVVSLEFSSSSRDRSSPRLERDPPAGMLD